MKIPWDNFERETIDHLRALVRLDTTNPPGNERLAADYLGAALGREAIECVTVEPQPTRTNLVARVAGRDRSRPSLMLSSHTDVVPVEASPLDARTVRRRGRARLRVGPRQYRHEVEMRDGPWSRARDQARRRSCPTAI